MPKLQEIDESLPLGAAPKYDSDVRDVWVYISPSKQIAQAGPGLKQFECPLLKTITNAEIPRLKVELLKALPNATQIRVVRGGEQLGVGIFAVGSDPNYKPPTMTKVDPTTVGGDVHHKRLWQVCREQEDYLAKKESEPWKPDCSAGCRYFMPLEGKHGMDWGVCTEPRSPRAGLLTFEHMGCQYFEQAPDDPEPSVPPKKSTKKSGVGS